MRLSVLALVGLLAACGPQVVYRDRLKTVNVPVRQACPDPAVYAEIKRLRPVPLRTQPMPATPEERVGKSMAQLGRYEAEGGWSDKAMAALDRCQEEGVAPSP